MNRIAALVLLLLTSAAFAQNNSSVPSSNGTVTSVATGCQATGGTITSTGTISTQVPINFHGAASFSVVAGDCGTLHVMSAATTAVSLPGAGTAGFPANWYVDFSNQGSGNATITPGVGTIGGAATLVIPGGSATGPKSVRLISDGSGNYYIQSMSAGSFSGSGTITISSTATSGIGSGNIIGSTSNLISDTQLAVTNVATISGTNSFTGNNSFAGDMIISDTTGANPGVGQLSLAGLSAQPTMGGNGSGSIYLDTTNGVTIIGQGSTNSLTFKRTNGTTVFQLNATNGGVTLNSGLTIGGAFGGVANLAQSGLVLGDLSNTWRNTSNNAAARLVNSYGNDNNTSLFQIILNSSTNTSGNGSGSATISGTSGLYLNANSTTGISMNTAGLIALPAITTDATHTDSTLCQDTTTHAIYFGSGASGVCLGTSSMRFKHDIKPLNVGLSEIMLMKPVEYKLKKEYGDPNKPLYGFIAENEIDHLPKLVGKDDKGRPTNFDYMGVVPILVKAIQEQQAEIAELKRKLSVRKAEWPTMKFTPITTSGAN